MRRLVTGGRQGNGAVLDMGLDSVGALGVDQVLPPKGLRTAAGCRFNAVIGNGATFLAPVTAYPTTALLMALYNGEPAGGKAYFIERVYAFLASGTPGVGGALLACVTTTSQPAPTLSTGDNGGYAGTKISGLSGKAAGASKAVFATAVTALAVPAWVMVDTQPAATATATIASACFQADIDGGMVVPPGYLLGLTALGAAGTTPLFGFGVVWSEVQVDLE